MAQLWVLQQFKGSTIYMYESNLSNTAIRDSLSVRINKFDRVYGIYVIAVVGGVASLSDTDTISFTGTYQILDGGFPISLVSANFNIGDLKKGVQVAYIYYPVERIDLSWNVNTSATAWSCTVEIFIVVQYIMP